VQQLNIQEKVRTQKAHAVRLFEGPLGAWLRKTLNATEIYPLEGASLPAAFALDTSAGSDWVVMRVVFATQVAALMAVRIQQEKFAKYRTHTIRYQTDVGRTGTEFAKLRLAQQGHCAGPQFMLHIYADYNQDTAVCAGLARPDAILDAIDKHKPGLLWNYAGGAFYPIKWKWVAGLQEFPPKPQLELFLC
jgi:hypothetical protein